MQENLFEKAIRFAIDAHKGQKRKDGIPFIFHPLEDAAIVATMTTDEAVLAAAVLHDTVEDTDVTSEDILKNFGERVHELVAHETEDKRPALHPSETWKIRKKESLEVLEKSEDPAVKMLWLGDKLSNMRAFRRREEQLGDEMFSGFNNCDPLEQKWYYETVLNLLSDLSYTQAYKEYERLFHETFDRFQGGK